LELRNKLIIKQEYGLKLSQFKLNLVTVNCIDGINKDYVQRQ